MTPREILIKAREPERPIVWVWNFDFARAPRGFTKQVWRKVKAKDGVEERLCDEFVHEPIIICTVGGEVLKSRWLPPTQHTPSGRWDGFPEHAKSIRAWMPWPSPPPEFVAAIASTEVSQ